MGGCRVGYMMAHPDLIREVTKATLPYNINIFSETVALLALEHNDELQDYIRRIVAERERLIAELKHLEQIKIYTSHANFVLIKLQHNATSLFEFLLARDILVRDVSRYPLLKNCLRISVGTEEENNRLVAAFREWA